MKLKNEYNSFISDVSFFKRQISPITLYALFAFFKNGWKIKLTANGGVRDFHFHDEIDLEKIYQKYSKIYSLFIYLTPETKQ
jgi:hypothetical protein